MSAMEPRIVSADLSEEFMTPERCFILETWNDKSDTSVSIARARVSPGVTTQLHSLEVDERYVIVSGLGEVQLGGSSPVRVRGGDAVVIPAGTAQQITNIGNDDLVFYCVCSPRFRVDAYQALE
jgi:mannose-6-phosphate isomerase-like protein (cupin superfamily)